MARYFDNIVDRNGNVVVGANILVTTPAGVNASLYSNSALTAPKGNPLTTDVNGEYDFYAAQGTYTLTISGPGITTRAITDVFVPDADVESAAASAASALASLNDFKGRWYGPLAADPAVDPLGAAIAEGDAYWNTVSNLLLIYNGATWQASDINTANLAASGGSALVGHRSATVTLALTPNGGLIPRSSAATLRAFGDSQTAGNNQAVAVSYTDGMGGLLPEFRWVNMIANSFASAPSVANFAVGGQRLGWTATGGSFQYSMFNQMGNLEPYTGGAETPSVAVVMAGWNSIQAGTTSEAFYNIVRRAHEANIARLLVERWGSITAFGWGDSALGGATTCTPGFMAGGVTSPNDGVASNKTSFNPFSYGDPNGARYVALIASGGFSQLTLTNQRAAAVFLETDPSVAGTATITVNGRVVATQDCLFNIAAYDDRFPVVVWLENLPATAVIRVACTAGTSVRLLAVGWVAPDSLAARRRSIIYGTTVANTASSRDLSVMYQFNKQTEAAVAAFADYGVLFANTFDPWVQAEDSEPQDVSHLTPAGNERVARAFLTAHPLPLRSSPNFVRLSGTNSGSFTLDAAATTVVTDQYVTASSRIALTPTNAAAAALMAGAKFLYVSAKSAGASFTVATADATAAGGTETFDYVITTP